MQTSQTNRLVGGGACASRQTGDGLTRYVICVPSQVLIVGARASAPRTSERASMPQGKPNILFIMADDVGWFNIGAYHRGMMAGTTPRLDSLPAEGMMFTDYYGEASCTAGRANFMTGQLPIRTGLTAVRQAGAHMGMPAQAPTVATAL
jgi:arylsulfatase